MCACAYVAGVVGLGRVFAYEDPLCVRMCVCVGGGGAAAGTVAGRCWLRGGEGRGKGEARDPALFPLPPPLPLGVHVDWPLPLGVHQYGTEDQKLN